jgi:hypothetical protein
MKGRITTPPTTSGVQTGELWCTITLCLSTSKARL